MPHFMIFPHACWMHAMGAHACATDHRALVFERSRPLRPIQLLEHASDDMRLRLWPALHLGANK